MLSNPTTLHQRQRQHRRQQSTPTAFEAPKVPILPTFKTNGSHRRGMSLDQRLRRQPPKQDRTTVSTTNNGFQQTQQHILRETQQQRLARPGQQQHAPLYNITNDENYLVSPLASPLSQSFEAACFNTYGRSQERPHSYSGYSGQINTTARVNSDSCSLSNSLSSPDPFLFTDDGLPSGFMNFSAGLEDSTEKERWATIRPANRPPSSRRVSGGIVDRVAIFEGMNGEQPYFRPTTPPTQYASNYFPPTPATTPFHRTEKQENVPQRFLDSYDTSMEDTIRPSRSKSNQRARTIFQEMRDHTEINSVAQPLERAQLSASVKCDSARIPTSDFMNMSNINLDFMKDDPGFEPSHYSPTTSNISPQMSQHSSPEISRASLFGDPFESKPDLDTSQNSVYSPGSPNPLHQSQARSPSAESPRHGSMDLDGVDLAETITDTGITMDDIGCYIDGPDPIDQKWTCLFPECKKRFGRKENIKSHVQTHLGDRQYQCPHCKKCFVRQHDLKRHAKIHSGVKPYPCMCGNSFARHDALTRHRQRGMCIGAFEGVVKKVVKRGRPRKARPDTEERHDKASRTRSKNKAMSSASSTTGYSDSSGGQSPPGDLDILDDKPFRDFSADFSQSSMFVSPNSFEYSSGASPLPSDYVSPQAIHNAPSPSAYSTHSTPSHHSYHSHRLSIDYSADPQSLLPALPASPAKSTASFYSTPPELCLSSSSPPPQHSQQSVYDPSSQFSQANDDMDMDLSKLVALQGSDDFATHDTDEMFLDAFGAAVGDLGASRLEQDPSLLLMGGKFDEDFGEWDGWS